MANFICSTCGTQYAESALPPECCRVCEDERQYVGFQEQRWTTLEELRAGHAVVFLAKGPHLAGIAIEPPFAIGQRALLVRDPGFPVLWDCIALVDDAAVAAVQAAGGARAIAVSHPHYYSSMVEWSRALGGIPIWLHEADRDWVMRPDAAVRFWAGDTLALADGLTLIRTGGHFAGGTVLHWARGAEGRGALLSGDLIQVGPDRKSVSFMYSYPNLIPLSPASVRRIVAAVEPYAFDAIYGAFRHRVIPGGAKEVVRWSAERYIAALGGAR